MWTCDLPCAYNLAAIKGFLESNFFRRYRITESDTRFTVEFYDWFVSDRFLWSLRQGQFGG